MRLNDSTILVLRPSKTWSGALWAGCAFMLLALIYSIFKYPQINLTTQGIETNIALASLLIFIIAAPTLGQNVTLKDTKLCGLDYFVFKKCIPVKDIVEITYPPTFIVRQLNRILNISGMVNGQNKIIQIAFPVYTRDSLLRLTQELRVINPSIRIDRNVEQYLYSDTFLKEAQKVKTYQIVGWSGALIFFFILLATSFYRTYLSLHPKLAVISPLSVSLMAGFTTYAVSGRTKYGLVVAVLVMALFLIRVFG